MNSNNTFYQNISFKIYIKFTKKIMYLFNLYKNNLFYILNIHKFNTCLNTSIFHLNVSQFIS